MDHASEHWQIRKPAVTGRGGMVASQHHLASDIGAEVLRDGGNAVDAAVATGLAIGTVEPWMSGIGGGGYMTVYIAAEDRTYVVEFGMRAPLGSIPDDYPIVGTETSEATFNWPRVKDDANIHGGRSVAVPGYIKGVSLALATFGTRDWAPTIEPACQLAEQGLPLDWYARMMISGMARGLNRYNETRRIYLADGLPPGGTVDGSLKYLQLGELASTYRTLQEEGPKAYYSGSLAPRIAADLAAAGSRINTRDLANYKARIASPIVAQYRNASVTVAGDLTAGPSLAQALGFLSEKLEPTGREPALDAFRAYADSLLDTYRYRLENLGEGKPAQNDRVPTNTTHICTADRGGNMVSLTQTIMSGMGSQVMLPATGILMNNGMMWFDPQPGSPNGVVGGRHPLCNMCPVIAHEANGNRFAVGACGGRKIFPAVFQLISFLIDYGMSVDEAVHQARIDVSGTDMVSLMDHMSPGIISAFVSHYDTVRVRPNGVSPMLFGLPQIIARAADGTMAGGSFVPSPNAKVSAV